MLSKPSTRRLASVGVVIAIAVAIASAAFAWREHKRSKRLRAGLSEISFRVGAADARALEAEAKALAAERQLEILKRDLEVAMSSLEAALPVEDIEASGALTQLIERRAVTKFDMFGSLDLYQRNGLVETYGGVLDQRRSGPISISETVLQPRSSEAWAIWTPDAFVPVVADSVRVELEDFLDQGVLSVGILTKRGQIFRWEVTLGAQFATPEAPASLEPGRRDQFLAGSSLAFEREGKSLIGKVPEALRYAARQGQIQAWFIIVSGASPAQSVTFRSIGLAPRKAAPDPMRTQIEGRIAGGGEFPVTLLLESNEIRRTRSNAQGEFRFENVPTEHPMSIRVAIRGRDRYADAGRWFKASDVVTPMRVAVEPQFENRDGHPINEKGAVLNGPNENVAFARYRPQSLILWPGTRGVQTFYREIEPLRKTETAPQQEFYGRTFTNSIGFVDRERFADNRDGCLRIAHAGGSSSVAIQVRPFEKFNILLEQELGVRLKRCVEVISAGRDNGDPGAVYPAGRDYLTKFRPDVTIVEFMQLLGLQMEPTLLRKLHGWDFDHSPLGHFAANEKGEYEYVPPDDSWPLSVTAPDRSPMTEGVPLLQTLSVPDENLSPEARSAFRNLEGAMAVWRKTLPSSILALQTGADQARCGTAATCGPVLTWPSGSTTEGGMNFFIENVGRSCAAAGVLCLQPPPIPADAASELLTYLDDGHYSIRGHQWLAKQLADQLEPELRKIPRR